MKRGSVNKMTTNISEESSNEQHTTDEEMEEEEDENSVVDDEIIDASATDSDEDECDSDFEKNSDVGVVKSKSEKIKENVLQRYQDRQGRQLYIRFPHKVPETLESLEEKVKAIAPLVTNVRKPRQRHARFCLADFATKEDRDSTLNKLKKSIKKGELKKYHVRIPRTESVDFVGKLAERKLKSIENKKAKQRLKKATKKLLKENNFTTTVIVLNLPKNSSILQIRELFPNAVDINVKPGKGKLNKDKSIAAITFPTTMDARTAVKNKLSLGGNQLFIKFDNKNSKQKYAFKKNDPKNITKKEELINVELESKIKSGSTEKSAKNKKVNKKYVNDV